MSKIIVLVDGSVYSQSVCDHAAWIASRTASAVDLLHVLPRRGGSEAPRNLSGSIALGARTSLLEELTESDALAAKESQKHGREILTRAQIHLEHAGISKVTTRLRIGDIAEEVADFEMNADIVVIGKRGEAADFVKLNLGANLERITRSCKKPVFVAARSFLPTQRFLIAFDGGVSSMKAVEYVADSPLFTGLPCSLLTIGSENSDNKAMTALAQSRLEAANITVSTAIIEGTPDLVIANAVETEGIGLLVMGAYGHSRIRNMIIGSTTTEMVHRCKIPIMLFR